MLHRDALRSIPCRRPFDTSKGERKVTACPAQGADEMYVKRTVMRKLDDVTRILTSATGGSGDVDRHYFTRAELDYCAGRRRSLGARLVIKECVFDHLETAFGRMEKRYEEIEIVNDELHKPMLRLSTRMDECARRAGIKDIRISISHSRDWIATMVVFCCQHERDRLSSSQREESF